MIGNWSASATESVAIPADMYRGSLTIQLYADGPVYLSFGSKAVEGKGIKLSSTFPVIVIDDHRAREAVHMVCAAAGTANGGYESA